MSRSERERAGPSVRALLGLVAALAVAIALSAFITLSRSPASGTTAASIPSATASRLTSAALRIARGSGDPRPLSVLVVRTSHAQALRVATPGDTVAGNLRSRSTWSSCAATSPTPGRSSAAPARPPGLTWRSP